MGTTLFQKELQMNQLLSNIVGVNNKFCRSVNLNLDFNNYDILKGIICPTSFKLVLEGMIDHISITGQSAFTWTGPYGAGKSSLALLLTALMGKNRKLREIAESIIGNSLIRKFYSKIYINKGWKVIPVMGELDNIENLISNEIEVKSINNIFNYFEEYINKNEGILLIVDEMGKCLEAAAQYSKDIFFYQKLAEYASRSNGKVIVIGILHQSFADYARYLPHNMRDEWTKVQGRYVDMPINTAGEEQIELISRAIKNKSTRRVNIYNIAKLTCEIIGKNRKIVSEKTLIDRFCRCWPINPVVITLLCQISRKKFGQNQRSIFSFLSSGEPMAFRDFINNNYYSNKILYMPNDLYDYIKYNLESAILASSDSKLWHIAIDALNKCQARGFSNGHIDVLKTITVIDLFSNMSGIVASLDLLQLLYHNEEIDVSNVVKDLIKLSVIIYKKHTSAYSIYEGSDFNIDKAIEEAYSDIDAFNIDRLTEIANFKPIIAKRYYHKHGSLRWFDVLLAPINDCAFFLKKEKQRSKATGIFVVLLPSTKEEQETAQNIIDNIKEYDFPVIFTIANNTNTINEYLRELLALEWIQNNRNELGGDSIARREIEDRIQLLCLFIETQLNNILVKSNWFINGEYKLKKLSELSILASDICEEVYSKTPIIKSELINRDRPSGNANTALYALLKDMVTSANLTDLGIEGFSPEKGLYSILLKNTGIHRQNNRGNYAYYDPLQKNLMPLWIFNDEYINNGRTISITELYEQWEKAPFGIKSGLFPFFLLAYILTRKNTIAIYKDGLYCAEISTFIVDVITSNPKAVAIKYIRSNSKVDEINNIIITLLNEKNKNSHMEFCSPPLIIAQNLVMLIDNLHPWVLKTKTLSKKAIQFREIVKSSNDPNKLLYEDIKKLFSTNNLYEELNIVLEELINVYPLMIKEVSLIMTNELDIPLVTPISLERIKERAKNIKGVAGNFKIDAFAARLSVFNASFNEIAGIISLANSKPQKEWIDLDIEIAKKEIIHLCTEFKKTELYTKIKNRPSSRQAIAFISGIGEKSEIILGEFDLLVEKQTEVKKLKMKLKQIIQKEKNEALVLTALAETSIELLKARK
jgi:hypothetical protein